MCSAPDEEGLPAVPVEGRLAHPGGLGTSPFEQMLGLGATD
jgi:hypothetical protein